MLPRILESRAEPGTTDMSCLAYRARPETQAELVLKNLEETSSGLRGQTFIMVLVLGKKLNVSVSIEQGTKPVLLSPPPVQTQIHEEESTADTPSSQKLDITSTWITQPIWQT